MKIIFFTGIALSLAATLNACGKQQGAKSEVAQRTSTYSTRLPSAGTIENAPPSHASSEILDSKCFANKNMVQWRTKTTSAINYQIQLVKGSAVFSYSILCESQERCIPLMNGASIEPNAYVQTQSTGGTRSFEFSDNRSGFSENYGYRYIITAFSQSRTLSGTTVMGAPTAVPECREELN